MLQASQIKHQDRFMLGSKMACYVEFSGVITSLYRNKKSMTVYSPNELGVVTFSIWEDELQFGLPEKEQIICFPKDQWHGIYVPSSNMAGMVTLAVENPADMEKALVLPSSVKRAVAEVTMRREANGECFATMPMLKDTKLDPDKCSRIKDGEKFALQLRLELAAGLISVKLQEI